MMLALMASLLGAAPVTPAAPTAASDDPPIKVWLNQDSYFQRGDKAKVHVKLADDGYLVVLRTDAEGRVRVLFPLDPTADDFVRGGHKLEARGRGRQGSCAGRPGAAHGARRPLRLRRPEVLHLGAPGLLRLVLPVLRGG